MALIELAADVTAMTDRNATVANVELFDPILGTMDTSSGSSKRESGDVYDSAIGIGLAVGRALVNLGYQLIDAAEAEVKRAAKENTKLCGRCLFSGFLSVAVSARG